MRSLFTRFVTAIVASSTIAVSTAHAQFLQYTTLAAWQATVLTPSVDTFNDLAFGTLAGPLNRTAGSIGYRASVAITGQSFYNVGPTGDRWLSTFQSNDTLVFNTFATPVRAIAASFFGTDSPGNALANTTVRVWATNAAGTSVFTLNNQNSGSFFGLTSTSNITSLRVTAVQPPGNNAWVTVNDFRVSTTVVPEPSTVLLLASGLLVLAVSTRRRRGA